MMVIKVKKTVFRNTNSNEHIYITGEYVNKDGKIGWLTDPSIVSMNHRAVKMYFSSPGETHSLDYDFVRGTKKQIHKKTKTFLEAGGWEYKSLPTKPFNTNWEFKNEVESLDTTLATPDEMTAVMMESGLLA